MPTVTNEFEVEADRDEAWEFFLTPDRVAPCVPGCESVDQVDDVTFEALVSVNVAYTDLTFDTRIEITDQDPPQSLTAEGTAEPTGRMPGSAVVTGDLRLDAVAEETTEGVLEIDFGIRGRLGTLGESAFRHKCAELTQEFVDNVKEELEGVERNEAV